MDEIKIERRYAISSDKHIELAHFLLRLDVSYVLYMFKSSLRNVLIKKCANSMFITAVCFFFLLDETTMAQEQKYLRYVMFKIWILRL